MAGAIHPFLLKEEQMENEFSLKELYDVFLKTTYPMEIAGKQFQEGEILCIFDKIQIANFNERKAIITAHGGFEDRDRVFWESTKEIDIDFSQGIFNTLQFALLNNAKLLRTVEDTAIRIPIREKIESNRQKKVILSHVPCMQKEVFFYNAQTGEKVDLPFVQERVYEAPTTFTEYLCDYYYDYEDGAQYVMLGNRLINGFLRLEGKTRVKDDITGKTRTGIIEIPKLKLMSDLSIRLGQQAAPTTVSFRAVGHPVGERDSSYVCNFYTLNDDIDSDM